MRKTKNVFRGTQQCIVVEALRGDGADGHARTHDDRGYAVRRSFAFVPRDNYERVATRVVRPSEDLRNPCRQPLVARPDGAIMSVVAQIGRHEGERGQASRGYIAIEDTFERYVVDAARSAQGDVIGRRVVFDGVLAARRRVAIPRHRLVVRPPGQPGLLKLPEDRISADLMCRRISVVRHSKRRSAGSCEVVR